MDLNPPPLVREIARVVAAAGGRALVVGGGVRDHLLGRAVHDWDLEVYGIELADLERLLRGVGRVNAVGKAFGVLKIHRGELEIDVALPRRDSKVGAGHKGIAVQGDKALDVREAARRRDLTVNAISCDPLTGEIVDPFEGRADLAKRVLRAVDAGTFLEDPLRALRAAQFAARLDFEVDPELVRLCAEAALEELPAERIFAEWEKLLLRGVRPSRGFALLREAGQLERLFPGCDGGPAGDAGCDALVPSRDALRPPGRALTLMVAAWLHRAPLGAAEAALERLGLHRVGGYAARDQALAALAARGEVPGDDAGLRRLATRAEPGIVLRVAGALDGAPGAEAALARAQQLGVETDPEPALLLGRHLIALGVAPGPAMGTLLKAAYDAQIDGVFRDEAAALAWVSARLPADEAR